MDLGPHAVYIWAAYGASAAVIAGLIYRAILQEREQRRVLVELEAKGIRRRSDTQK